MFLTETHPPNERERLVYKSSGRGLVYRVYWTLRENIMDLTLAPGAVLNESDVAKELNVSRTPVREAFVQLHDERLINIYPQRGSSVSKIDMELVKEGSFMRRCLEEAVYAQAAELAGEDAILELHGILAKQKELVAAHAQSGTKLGSDFIRLDDRLHRYLFALCGKNNIWDSIVSINTHHNRLRVLELWEHLNIYKVIFQHEMIIDAIEKRQPEKIKGLISEHHLNVIGIIDHIRDKYPDYFL